MIIKYRHYNVSDDFYYNLKKIPILGYFYLLSNSYFVSIIPLPPCICGDSSVNLTFKTNKDFAYGTYQHKYLTFLKRESILFLFSHTQTGKTALLAEIQITEILTSDSMQWREFLEFFVCSFSLFVWTLLKIMFQLTSIQVVIHEMLTALECLQK